MSAFKATGRTIHHVKVPSVDERGVTTWHKRTTGTRDANTAKKMQRVVHTLGPSELAATAITDALVARTLTVPRLWSLWTTLKGDDQAKVKAILALLADADLLAKRAGWIAKVTKRASAATAEQYDRYLDKVVEAIGVNGTLPRSRTTVEALQSWLDALPNEPGTVRKHHAGVATFFAHLKAVEAIERNPMREIKPPKAPKARDRHLTAAEAMRLADAQPSPYREFSALLAGTGIEVGVALKLRVRDVDVTHREIRAKGTKTHNRDRVARVATWAWRYVERAMHGKTPETRLFGGIESAKAAREMHDETCERLGIEDYTNRDARHSFAVRAIKAGTPPVQVSKQLGHKDATMVVKVYGNYEPTQAERDHWEQIAAAKDAAEEAK
jgi:integrase